MNETITLKIPAGFTQDHVLRCAARSAGWKPTELKNIEYTHQCTYSELKLSGTPESVLDSAGIAGYLPNPAITVTQNAIDSDPVTITYWIPTAVSRTDHAVVGMAVIQKRFLDLISEAVAIDAKESFVEIAESLDLMNTISA